MSSPSQYPESVAFPSGDPRNVYMDKVRAFLASIGGRQSLGQEDVQSQLSVVCNAIIHGDHFFLILHQIFYLWITNSTEIPGFLRAKNGFVLFMNYLAGVLCSNDTLPPGLLTFFAQFPEPLQHFILHSSSALQIQQQIIDLINGMHHIEALVRHCMQRKYPPLVMELQDTLSVRSIYLMDVVFTSILRSIWGQPVPYNPPFYEYASKVFQNDLATWQHATASGAPLQTLDHNATIQQYLSLYKQVQEANIRSQAAHITAQQSCALQQQSGFNEGYATLCGGSSAPNRLILLSSIEQAPYQTPSQLQRPQTPLALSNSATAAPSRPPITPAPRVNSQNLDHVDAAYGLAIREYFQGQSLQTFDGKPVIAPN
jgi:hypothetical protein